MSRQAENGKPGRVAGYYRVSKARGGMIAPELYEEEIRRYADYRDLSLVEPLFSDIDVSGRSTARHLRKGLDELLARRHEFSGVVVPSLDRLGRSVSDIADIFKTLDDDRIAIHSVKEQIDTASSSGRLTRNILASLAEFYSDRISESWQAVIAHRRGQGHLHSSRPPWGYVWRDGELVPVPEKAELVREAYERYVAGESQHATAHVLGLEPRQLLRILTKPCYAGRHEVDGELVEGRWEPMVEWKVWEQAQSVRKARSGAGFKGRPPGSGKRLLSGLLWCGRCGGAMHSATRGGYACQNWRKCGNAHLSARGEQYVIDEFVRYGFDHLAELAKRRKAERGKGPIAALERRRAGIDRRIANLVSRAADSPGAAFEREFARQASVLEDEREVVEGKIARAQVVEMELDTLPVQIEVLMGEGRPQEMDAKLPTRSPAAAWFAASTEERRRLLKLAIERIVTTEDPAKLPRFPGTGANPTRWVEIRWS